MESSKSNEPLVSIVINNYNYARFLSAAIESALNQTYQNTEIVVVDDGSTDESAQVMERYLNRITAIYKDNGGQASAMNRGFNAAQGELIYFLDSDDIALPDCVERVVAAYRTAENPTAMLNFRLCLINEKGESLNEYSPALNVRLPSRDVAAQLRQKGTFRHQPTSANVFSAESLQKIMPIPEEDFRICAETYLCYHAPLFGEVQAIEETLALYRVHGSNNYHQPDKIYDSTAITNYVAKQESFYRAIEKSRRRFAANPNLTIGGNANLLHLIFKSAAQKLSKKADSGGKKLSNLRLAIESLREVNRPDAGISGRRKIAVMCYLATIALLPERMVCPLVALTFIRSPKSLDFLMKKSLSR